MKPKRIQRKRIKDWRMPPNTVYVGRPTKWGNPFKGAFTPEKAVELYKTSHHLRHLVDSGDIKELKGKNLCCWCPLDKSCHADILLEIANQ